MNRIMSDAACEPELASLSKYGDASTFYLLKALEIINICPFCQGCKVVQHCK